MDDVEQQNDTPVFSFGVISDVQYADHDDAINIFPPFRKRYYKNGLKHLEQAILEFKSENAEFIIQLGDLIDGKSKQESEAALNRVLDIIHRSDMSAHHTLGNHDLYNFSHRQATDVIIKPTVTVDKAYYSFMCHNFRFICLDCYDVAILGRSGNESSYSLAREYLAVNPNSDHNSSTGLVGVERRFVGFNGGLSDAQLVWLAAELKTAEEGKQQVVVYGHCGISPHVTPHKCLIWNYKEVYELLEGCANVRLVLSGHTHHCNHGVSPSGTHYVTLQGVIETPPEDKAWALVRVWNDCVKIKIYSTGKSEELTIPLTV